MNKQQKEICLILIDNAKTKKEVFDTIMTNFKEINQIALGKYVDANWNLGSKKETICLRKLNYSEKHILLADLLKKKDEGIIKKISITILKDIERVISNEMYKTIIPETNSAREKAKGNVVQLLRNKNGIVYEVKYSFYIHDFTIWDISSRDSIHIEYSVRPA